MNRHQRPGGSDQGVGKIRNRAGSHAHASRPTGPPLITGAVTLDLAPHVHDGLLIMDSDAVSWGTTVPYVPPGAAAVVNIGAAEWLGILDPRVVDLWRDLDRTAYAGPGPYANLPMRVIRRKLAHSIRTARRWWSA